MPVKSSTLVPEIPTNHANNRYSLKFFWGVIKSNSGATFSPTDGNQALQRFTTRGMTKGNA